MDLAKNLIKNIGAVIGGKDKQIKMIVAAFLAGGHVLLEDVPGTGKTMLAKALARSVNCDFGRVQFTPDLLPSELMGINFYSPQTGEFSFRQGSLFTNILLADEINRATPRTQSGLLESMEEMQVSVDGQTYPLPSPYFVIATQNPVETAGTFPLPEAQLDRFIIKISLGYPSTDETAQIIAQNITGCPIEEIKPVCDIPQILSARQSAKSVRIHDDIYDYIARLGEATRTHETAALGVSTRGLIALSRMAQSLAMIDGRDFVTPDDVKLLVPEVFGHRIISRGARTQTDTIISDVLGMVKVPTEEWEK